MLFTISQSTLCMWESALDFPALWRRCKSNHNPWSACLILVCLAVTSRPASAQRIDASTEAQIKRATVMVYTLASERQRADTMLGSGTGFFINHSGLLVTNNHVVDPAHGKSPRARQEFQYTTNRLIYTIVLESGTKNQRIVECDLIHQSVSADQALLQARDPSGNLLATPDYLRLLPNWRLQVGMNVFAFGFPGGNSLRKSRDTNAEISLSQGVVISVPRAPSGRIRRIETNAIARPGNSGGPMVNADGLLVGTITLMGQAKGQANACALVPNTLTQAMLRRALEFNLLPAESDLSPFVAFAVESGDVLALPGLDRSDDADMLVLRNDERIYGTLDHREVQWRSPVGDFNVPVDSIAYMLFGPHGYTLALEGGDSLTTANSDLVIRFTTRGGERIEKTPAEVCAVAVRRHEMPTSRARTDVVALTSPSDRVVFDSAPGQVKLDSRSGQMEVAIDRIEQVGITESGNRQIVTLSDGQQLTGRLGATSFPGVHRATGRTIPFKLDRARDAKIELIEFGSASAGGMTLTAVIGRDIEELYKIARSLERGELDAAREMLTPYLPREKQVKMPVAMKWEVRLLEGVLALRTGDASAMKKIRRCFSATDPKLAAYARGCVAVLKAYGKEFEGRPLNDPEVFAAAGKALGVQLIRDARAVLEDRKNLQGKSGEYHQYIRAIEKQEKRMEAASAFAGPDADDVLIELWSFAIELCSREADRLYAKHEKLRAGRTSGTAVLANKLKDIRKNYEKVATAWVTRYEKLRGYGFHYSDALDIRKLSE